MSVTTERDKEKKGAGVPWMNEPLALGSTPGVGVPAKIQALGRGFLYVNGKTTILGKLAIAASSKGLVLATMAGGLAVGIHGTMDMNQRGGFGIEAPKQEVHFDRRGVDYTPEQLAGVPSTSVGGKSALEMAYEANAGRVAGDEAQAPAVEEAAASADAEADAIGAAEGEPGEAGNGNNPDDLMAGLMGKESSKAKAGLGKKFGQLSSGLGGGGNSLSGGSGMSGGIGGQFKQQGLTNSRLRQNASAKAFSGNRKAGASRSKVAAQNRGRGTLRTGDAGRRLSGMQAAMSGARGSGGESQAATHARQWDSASTAGGGQSVGGAGAGIGDGFSDVEGGGMGSSVDQSPGANPNSDVYDTADVGDAENVTPYQQMVDMAQMLLTVASALLLASFLVGLMAQSDNFTFGIGKATLYAIAKYLAYAAMAVAAIVTILGVAIMAQGQMQQGAMFTVVGGLLTILSYTSAEANAEAAAAEKGAETAVEPTVEQINQQMYRDSVLGMPEGGGTWV